MMLRRVSRPEIELLRALARFAWELWRGHVTVHITRKLGSIAIRGAIILGILAHAAITAGATPTATTATSA